MGTSPAFQFYVADYVMGTMTLGLAEEGAYMRCLCVQWDTGAVPGDDPQSLARVMRCTERDAKKHWAVIAHKFTRGDDGLWRNPRMEREREKQIAYRAAQAENGKNGGRPRKNIKPEKPEPFVSDKPNETQTKALQSSSSSSETPPQNGGVEPPPRREPWIPKGRPGSPLRWGLDHAGCVDGFCGWQCLFETDFNKFATRLPGGPAAVMAWAKSVRESGIVPTGKPWAFWNEQFDAAHGKPAAGGNSDSDYAKWAPGGAVDRGLS